MTIEISGVRLNVGQGGLLQGPADLVHLGELPGGAREEFEAGRTEADSGDLQQTDKNTHVQF